jgi:hypothetical protein
MGLSYRGAVEEAAHAKKMLARLATKRARQDAAKVRLEQTAQSQKMSLRAPSQTRLSRLKPRSHHPVVLAWPGCVGRLYRAGRHELVERDWLLGSRHPRQPQYP